jgi:hypothetical protein
MREEAFIRLEARWRELYDQYEAVKAKITPVVRWEWTNGKRYDMRPYYFQRNPVRGRVLKKTPTTEREKVYKHLYGFDAQGRVVVQTYYTYYGVWETFYSYTPDEVVMMTFEPYQGRQLLNHISCCAKKLGRVQDCAGLTTDYSYIDRDQTFPSAGQLKPNMGEGLENTTLDNLWIRLSQTQDAMKWSYEVYLYQRGRLIDIHHYSSLDHDTPTSETHFYYNPQGHLQQIWWERKDIDYARLLYQRRKPGETWASLTEAAKQKLVAEIPKVIAAAKLQEPLYCLNLYYFLAKNGDYFPPELLLGFERDRQWKMEKYPPDRIDGYLWWYLWDGEEPEHVPYEPLEITDADTLAACEALEAEINMRLQSPIAERTLYQIARELNQLDWSKITPVTPDFIVYACDQTEHVNPEDSLRRSGATKEQLKDWRKRGMLY